MRRREKNLSSDNEGLTAPMPGTQYDASGNHFQVAEAIGPKSCTAAVRCKRETFPSSRGYRPQVCKVATASEVEGRPIQSSDGHPLLLANFCSSSLTINNA